MLSPKQGALFVAVINEGAAAAADSSFVGVRVREEDLLSLLCGDSSIFCFSGGEHVGQ